MRKKRVLNGLHAHLGTDRWIGGTVLASSTLLLVSISSLAAEEPAAASGRLEEVVVTAQFIKQNLQETPVAITAISAQMLEARGHATVEQIAAQAPNVTLTTGGAFGGPSLVAFIRGVGQTDFNPAVEPGVGLYVDDVYYSTLTGSILDLLDLDRVEVLRGPQGTLAGKNSIGGSIKLYPKRPGPDSDGYVEAGYGSFNAVNVRAASNFVLVPDQLYARLAGVSRSRDGYIERRDYGCSHPGSGFPSNGQGSNCTLGHEGGVKYTAARAALRWLASDAVELNLAGNFVNDVSEAPANVLLATAQTTAPVVASGLMWDWNLPGTSIPVSANVGCMFIAYGSRSCDPNSPNDPYINYSNYIDQRTDGYGPSSISPKQTIESRDVALNVDWQISDALQLQSISAYRKYTSGWGSDPDGSPMPVLQLYQTLEHTQKSQELRLNGKAGTWLDYTLGAFYFDQQTSEDGRINLGYVGFDFIHGPDPVDAPTRAAFAHGIVHATDKMDLSVGIRYSDEKKEYAYRRTNADGSAIQPCIGPPGTPGNPPNCLISSLNGTSSAFEDTRVDYRVALTYRWTDALMTYAQVSTGYKGGGVNPRPFYNVQAFTFDPEELTSYELGVKTQLLQDTLRLNAAVFSTKYEDIQLQLNNCTVIVAAITGDPNTPLGVPCLGIANAGNADVMGAELEFDWAPNSALLVDGSISYLDFEYTSIDPGTGLGIRTVDPVTGRSHRTVTPYTPEIKASIGMQYTFDVGSGGAVTPRVDVSYQDEIYTAADNSQLGAIDSYTLVNASLTWRSLDQDWQATLEARNVADKLYYLSKTDSIPGGGGVTYGAPGLPRTYLFTVKRSF